MEKSISATNALGKRYFDMDHHKELTLEELRKNYEYDLAISKEWNPEDDYTFEQFLDAIVADGTCVCEMLPAYIVTIWNYEYDAWNDPQEKAVFCSSSLQAAKDEAVRIKKETPSYMVMMSKYIVPANLYNTDAILAAAETGAYLAFEDEDLYIEPEYVDEIDINGNTI